MLTVIPTIDVEAVHGKEPFKQMIIGDFGGGGTWGVYRQAEIFTKYGISATFFVDVYEYTMWGEDALREVCCRLLDMGQDVQLHTHPGWRKDPEDPAWLQKYRHEASYLGSDLDFMTKLSFEQQKNVLEHGMELLHKWTGKVPIAHRSGGYSINQDTLSALSAVGIPVDSSMNCSHPNSVVTWSKNAIVEKSGIIELPVTVGEYVASLGLGSVRLPVYRRLMKTDLDIFSTEEFLIYSSKALVQGIRLMNIFMHSHSLIDLTKGWAHLQPDPRDTHKFEETLDRLSSLSEVQFLNCSSFYESYQASPKSYLGSDNIPEIPLKWSKALKYGLRKIKNLSKIPLKKLQG